MNEQIKINWYRSKVDKALMSELMRKSDARAFRHVITQLLLYAATGTLSYLAFLQVHVATWPWALPLLLLALFVHFSFSHFFGGVAGHELTHKTPFATQFWNSFFLRIYAFLSWFDPYGYRASHVRHHQATAHRDHDGEIILPQGFDWHGIKFALMNLTINPKGLFKLMRFWVAAARGDLSRDGFFNAKWIQFLIPETNRELRREITLWARIVVFGHLALAALFIATGHWFLIVIVTFGCQPCGWLEFLCAAPQHVGLAHNATDFRLNTRTYTSGFLPAFLYWNMQYHVEHHTFPAVPFYNLPRLRKAIEHDLPPAPHGLWATWQVLLPIMRRQRDEPGWVYVPPLPNNEGERVGDKLIEAEAAQ